MKSFFMPALAAVLLSVLLSACAAPPPMKRQMIPACEGSPRSQLLGLQGDYVPAAANSCKVAIEPFDVSAWIEAPLNSARRRGLNTLALGCANLTPSSADCSYGGPLGHAATLQMNFDLARYPDTALVQRAVLAVRVHKNARFLVDAGQLRGRLLVGDALVSLGSSRSLPNSLPGWVLFDITDFAARAVNERRTSVSFELSLPCGRSEEEVVTVSVLSAEPKIVVEFR
jgi:hypothetical protein